MVRLRRPEAKVGRSEFQLRLPYQNGSEAFFANFRELERWGNALPLPPRDKFVPYWIQYEPEDSQSAWNIDLLEIMQATYAMNLVPTGLWIVHVSCQLDYDELPDECVGAFTSLTITNDGLGVQEIKAAGYQGGGIEAIRTIADIDFTLETVEYEWVLPYINISPTIQSTAQTLTRLRIISAADSSLNVLAYGSATTIIDKTAGPELNPDNVVPTFVKAWAYRLTDEYGLPGEIENITPP